MGNRVLYKRSNNLINYWVIQDYQKVETLKLPLENITCLYNLLYTYFFSLYTS